MAAGPLAGGYYPPVGFHFKVEFIGLGNDNDVRFQAVSGLSLEYDTETYKEGGENRFEHKLPGRTKYSDLTLKRGMLLDSEVMNWVLDGLQNRSFSPRQVNISLLNAEHQPLRTWAVQRAWPRKWSVADLNAQENSVLIETLELSYSHYTLT